jgi:hypothetical protein
MKIKSFKIQILCLLLLTATANSSKGWGFWGHKKINHMACFTLPPEMIGFYKSHIDFITEHAVDPDNRRYSNKAEPPRHYLDADHYGEHPFDSLPKYWKDAVAKYTEDTLNAYGIVPWYVAKMMFSLTDAFKDRNVDKILYFSANIGHYIADSHVPLHATENYNGQKTNQVGIHAFWESRIPELYGDDYDFIVGRAEFISNIQMHAWGIIEESASEVDSVLGFEKKLSKTFPSDKKYSFEQVGNKTDKVYSEEYTKAYSDMLDGMVERKIRTAIFNVGSFWYTAWVNAGSPDLDSIGKKEVTEEMKKNLEEEQKQSKILKSREDEGKGEEQK